MAKQCSSSASHSEASQAIRETLSSFLGASRKTSQDAPQAIDLEMALLLKMGKVRVS